MNTKIIVLSDIHLGHDKNKTEDIIYNLRRWFKIYDKDIKISDLLVISGDIFDKLLSTNGKDMNMIFIWLTELVMLCKKYDLILRVLEGTPGHDWNQFGLLFNSLKKLNLDVDMKYYEELDIEFHEVLKKHILYIPDEWKPTPKEIYTDVLNKLKDKKIEKVDIAIMHGAFSYQLPEFIEHTLDPEDYLKIVDGPIIIGHVHKHSVYKRILVPGSFDALTHEDDYRNEVKGGLMIDIKDDNKFTYKFLPNKYQLKFITEDIVGKDLLQVKELLSKLHNEKEHKHIRLLIDDDDQIAKNIQEMKDLFPNLTILIKKHKNKDDEKSEKERVIVKLVSKRLDKEAIVNYIEKKITINEKEGVLRILNEL